MHTQGPTNKTNKKREKRKFSKFSKFQLFFEDDNQQTMGLYSMTTAGFIYFKPNYWVPFEYINYNFLSFII